MKLTVASVLLLLGSLMGPYCASAETCAEIIASATTLVSTAPECVLVKALFDGADILSGTPEEVKGVCDAKTPCTDQLVTLVTSATEQGCTMDVEMEIDAKDVMTYATDVDALTAYLCTGDCYTYTQTIATGLDNGTPVDQLPINCDCEAAYIDAAGKMSATAQEYLGIDQNLPIIKLLFDSKCGGAATSSAAGIGSDAAFLMATIAMTGVAAAGFF